ncbi:MAG: PDC sensor domain-containing protein [Candidatus Sedimenticola sp. PURPLELP]
MLSSALQKSIDHQRKALEDMVAPIIHAIASDCSDAWPEREALNQALESHVKEMPYVAYLYVLGTDGIQICDNVNKNGRFIEHFGRDRSGRPYLKKVLPAVDLLLSDAYISLLSDRPSITAIQLIKRDGRVVGYLGADLDLRDLPLTQKLYDEPGQWRQIKGDPAIRSLLFQQTRVKSVLDTHIDEAISILTELYAQRGVFHGKLLFSSSRATLWLVEDPYSYRILEMEALIDPDICLAYPLRPYPDRAVVPQNRIKEIFEGFKKLRFADETVYLRSGSLNIFNGLVALNFSCDGSHYLRWDEFLDPQHTFWAGNIDSTSRPA